MKILEALRSIIRSTKRETPKTKFCPRCGGKEIILTSTLGGWLTPSDYACLNCGYEGVIVLEASVEKEETDDDGSATSIQS